MSSTASETGSVYCGRDSVHAPHYIDIEAASATSCSFDYYNEPVDPAYQAVRITAMGPSGNPVNVVVSNSANGEWNLPNRSFLDAVETLNKLIPQSGEMLPSWNWPALPRLRNQYYITRYHLDPRKMTRGDRLDAMIRNRKHRDEDEPVLDLKLVDGDLVEELEEQEDRVRVPYLAGGH